MIHAIGKRKGGFSPRASSLIGGKRHCKLRVISFDAIPRLMMKLRAMANPLLRRLAAVALAFWLSAAAPVARAQQAAPVPACDATDRAQVVSLYQHYYLPSVNLRPGWTGSLATGDPGTLNDTFRQGIVQRINYFRAMSGVGSGITFDAASNAMCQQAALMMASAQNISHTPPATWPFYTADAAAACAHADIRLDWQGDEGAGAIDRFMADDESNNTYVGHRRWLVYPGESVMASGAVPGDGSTFPGTNATWVMNVVPRPADAPVSTSWPPAGFVPAPLVYNRWSFSYLNADFSAASVRVSKHGAAMRVQQEALEYQTAADGSGAFEGDNTLVWELPGNVVGTAGDEVYTVKIANVLVNGVAHRFTYTVTSIDPVGPVVSLATLKPVAHVGGKKGRFLVTRTGDVSAPLTVAYTVGGTAEAGSAYKALSGSLTIPAGSATAKVAVVALDAAGTDGATVAAALQAGSGYTADTTASATVTISAGP